MSLPLKKPQLINTEKFVVQEWSFCQVNGSNIGWIFYLLYDEFCVACKKNGKYIFFVLAKLSTREKLLKFLKLVFAKRNCEN